MREWPVACALAAAPEVVAAAMMAPAVLPTAVEISLEAVHAHMVTARVAVAATKMAADAALAATEATADTAYAAPPIVLAVVVEAMAMAAATARPATLLWAPKMVQRRLLAVGEEVAKEEASVVLLHLGWLSSLPSSFCVLLRLQAEELLRVLLLMLPQAWPLAARAARAKATVGAPASEVIVSVTMAEVAAAAALPAGTAA